MSILVNTNKAKLLSPPKQAPAMYIYKASDYIDTSFRMNEVNLPEGLGRSIMIIAHAGNPVYLTRFEDIAAMRDKLIEFLDQRNEDLAELHKPAPGNIKPLFSDLALNSMYLVRVAYSDMQIVYNAVLFTHMGEAQAKICCTEYERSIDYKFAYFLQIEKKL